MVKSLHVSMPSTAHPKGNRLRRLKREKWLLRQRRKKQSLKRRRSVRPIALLSGIDQHTKGSVCIVDGKKLWIEFPESLDFEKNYESTTSHLNFLRSAIRLKKPIHYADFAKIRNVAPAAALVLASILDQWKLIRGGKLRSDDSTWDPEVRRLLCQMGLFKLLHLEPPDVPQSPSGLMFLPFKRGAVEQAERGELAKQLRLEIERMTGIKIRRQVLFEGLSEAITNVIQHAYNTKSDCFRRKLWWMSASFEAKSKLLQVIFFDQGDGIPRTLPNAHFFELIKDKFGMWTDAQKIHAATEVGRSSSGRTERGRGLGNLMEFAKVHRKGMLRIYSLKGCVSMKFVQSADLSNSEVVCLDNERSIEGTLIEWSVKL